MLLRESGKTKKMNYNLKAIVDLDLDSGVENGDVLLAFADAISGTDQAELKRARAVVEERMGGNAVIEAAIVASNFSMLDRIANAVGIPLEDFVVSKTQDFWAELGIDKYPSASYTPEGGFKYM